MENWTFSSLTRKIQTPYALILLIITWINCSNIILKCYSSIILNNYFNIKSVPYFSSLEEILTSNLVSVSGQAGLDQLLELNKYNEHLILSQKLSDYENKRNISTKEYKYNFSKKSQVIKDVIDGRVVLFTHPSVSNKIQNFFPQFDFFALSEKYKERYAYFYLSNKLIYHDQITLV